VSANAGLGLDTFAFRVDRRVADLDVLGPVGDQAPAHGVETALARLRVEAHHRGLIGRREIPGGQEVRRGPMRRDRECDLDLVYIR